MAESDSLKRTLIVLATAGKTTPSRRHKLDDSQMLHWLRQCFPTRDHKTLTLKLALERLNRRGWILTVATPGRSPRYLLSRSGFERAKRLWPKRVRFDYFEPKELTRLDQSADEQPQGLARTSAAVLAIIRARHQQTGNDSERRLAA